jgi:hypothetical protein
MEQAWFRNLAEEDQEYVWALEERGRPRRKLPALEPDPPCSECGATTYQVDGYCCWCDPEKKERRKTSP